MAQLTWYLKAATGNWDAANAWNDAADGSGTDRTNPQNGGGNTYICDLNAKTVAINVAVSVDQIRTGATNAGGTFSIPNSTAAVITVATATTGLYSNYAGTMISWGTGTCSLTVNGDVTYASTSTSGMLTVTTSGTITVNGKVSNSGTGYCIVTAGSGALTISNSGGTATDCTNNTSGRTISSAGTGAVIITGAVVQNHTSYYGTANNIASSSASHSITGDISTNAGGGNCVTVAAGTMVITGNISSSGGVSAGTSSIGVYCSLGTVTIDGALSNANAGRVLVVNSTCTWVGARTLANNTDCTIELHQSGTLNLATASSRLVLTNSGRFAIRKMSTGTITTTAAGGTAEINNQAASAQACIQGGDYSAIIHGPTLPAAANVRLSGTAQYGYAGALFDGTISMPNSGTPTGTEDATSDACVVSGKNYGAGNARTGSAAGGSGGGLPILGGSVVR